MVATYVLAARVLADSCASPESIRRVDFENRAELTPHQVSAKSFVSDGAGKVRGINTVRVDWQKDLSGNWVRSAPFLSDVLTNAQRMAEIAGSEEFFEADLVLLALGFLGPEEAALKQLGIEQDARSNVKAGRGGKYSCVFALSGPR